MFRTHFNSHARCLLLKIIVSGGFLEVPTDVLNHSFPGPDGGFNVSLLKPPHGDFRSRSETAATWPFQKRNETATFF